MLFTYEENDEVVFSALKEFEKKTIVSAENYLITSEDTKDDNAESQGESSRFEL